MYVLWICNPKFITLLINAFAGITLIVCTCIYVLFNVLHNYIVYAFSLIVTIGFIADSSINMVNFVVVIYLDMILILFEPSGSHY